MTDNPDDDTIRSILTQTRTVAVVGWSPRAEKPSNSVARALHRRGMTVIPVHPGHAGTEAMGQRVRASLSDIAPDEGVEMVDIFRRSSEAGAVVDEALAHLPGLKVIWMQLGIRDEAAAARARARGVIVVQDRCPLVESRRLGI